MKSGIIRQETLAGVVYYTPKQGITPYPKESKPFQEALIQERLEAYQKGKEHGEKLGYEKATNEMSALMTLLQKMVQRILEQKERLLQQLKPEIIEFAIAICEKFLREKLSQPEKLVRLIDSLLAQSIPFFQGELVKIVLSPEDLVMLEQHLKDFHYDRREIKGLRFLSDPELRRGDFRIENKSGLLNFLLQRELEELRGMIERT